MKFAEAFETEVESFLSAPFPLWESTLTTRMVQAKYENLMSASIRDKTTYSTSAALYLSEASPNKQFLFNHNGGVIYLENPDTENLSAFYSEHGLITLSEEALINANAASKLKAALNVLSLIPDCITCISELVNCIQVVSSEGPEYDTSYSHPDLPFTIFVSVCGDDSLSARLRIAESILHEAMHLKLSLIQQYIELVDPNNTETFFSPWRNAQRPLIGVLHGLFVFRAIKDFFQAIRDYLNLENQQYNFVTYRILDIETDFQALQYFSRCAGLTSIGAEFAGRLQQTES